MIKAESMAEQILSLDCVKVEVEVLIGIPPSLKTQWRTAISCPDPKIAYIGKKEMFFDHSDFDEALLKALLQHANQDRKPAKLLQTKSLADAFLGNKLNAPQMSVLDKASDLVEQCMYWNSDSHAQIAIVKFIEEQVPFVKTREWLYDQFKELIASDSERFIGHIGVTARPLFVFGR